MRLPNLIALCVVSSVALIAAVELGWLPFFILTAQAGPPKVIVQKPPVPQEAPDAGRSLLTVLGRREVVLDNLPGLTAALGQKTFKPFFSQGSSRDVARDAVFVVFDGDKGQFGLFFLYSDGAWHVVKDDFL